MLGPSLLVTLTTTAKGFALALIGGVGLAILFAQSRLVEFALYPFAVILQVTPVLAIAPLLLIYLPQEAARAGLRLDRRLLPDPVQHRASACARPTTTSSTSSISTAPRPGRSSGT